QIKREKKVNETDFSVNILKVIGAGGQPVTVCECGYLIWLYKGTISEHFHKLCPKCESTNRIVLGDFRKWKDEMVVKLQQRL
ncbi:MAG: hypothetical protein RIS64_4356, partial [Bacteroidota bacterium]